MDSFSFDAPTDHRDEIETENKENEVDLELDNWFSQYQNSNRPGRISKSNAMKKMRRISKGKRNTRIQQARNLKSTIKEETEAPPRKKLKTEPSKVSGKCTACKFIGMIRAFINLI